MSERILAQGQPGSLLRHFQTKPQDGARLVGLLKIAVDHIEELNGELEKFGVTIDNRQSIDALKTVLSDLRRAG